MNGRGSIASRVKDGNGMLALGEDKVPKIWKDYLEDIDSQE